MNQTLDAHWSLPQLWLSGEDTVTAMTEKRDRHSVAQALIL